MKRFAATLMALMLGCALAAAGWQRTEDVIYGRRPGVALALDVLQPDRPNGFGLAFLYSSGWHSDHDMIAPAFFRVLLDRGYTVFAVVHGGHPKYQMPEIFEDNQRAMRFIRHNAGRYGIRPDRLGVMGASAGGHLALLVATRGGPGPADAKDPVDRESSAAQAVACFFPPTDFLNYGEPGGDGAGAGLLKDARPAFDPTGKDDEARRAVGRDYSPANWIHPGLPPILIIHGDADTLVPPQQATWFADKARAAGATVELVRKPGLGHGWPNLDRDLPLLADFFDRWLRQLPTAREDVPK